MVLRRNEVICFVRMLIHHKVILIIFIVLLSCLKLSLMSHTSLLLVSASHRTIGQEVRSLKVTINRLAILNMNRSSPFCLLRIYELRIDWLRAKLVNILLPAAFLPHSTPPSRTRDGGLDPIQLLFLFPSKDDPNSPFWGIRHELLHQSAPGEELISQFRQQRCLCLLI